MEEILHHRTTYRMCKALKIMKYLPYQLVIAGVSSINHMSKTTMVRITEAKWFFSPMDLTPEESVWSENNPIPMANKITMKTLPTPIPSNSEWERNNWRTRDLVDRIGGVPFHGRALFATSPWNFLATIKHMALERNIWGMPTTQCYPKLVHPLVIKFVRVARTTQWPLELPAPPSPNVLSRELDCWRKTTTMTYDTVTPMASFHFFKKLGFARSAYATGY